MGSKIVTLFSYKVRCSLVALLALGDREVVGTGLRLRDLCERCGLNRVRMMGVLMTLCDHGFIELVSTGHQGYFRLSDKCQDYSLYKLVSAVDGKIYIGQHSMNDPAPLANRAFNLVAKAETDIYDLIVQNLELIPLRYFFLNNPQYMEEIPGLRELFNRNYLPGGIH